MHPEGAQVQNQKCEIPLHCAAACRQEEHFQVVAKALIEAYPGGLLHEKELTVEAYFRTEPPVKYVHRGLSDESVQLLVAQAQDAYSAAADAMPQDALANLAHGTSFRVKIARHLVACFASEFTGPATIEPKPKKLRPLPPRMPNE